MYHFPPPRLFHCHKAGQNVKIFEDYEEKDAGHTLLRSSCSQCRAEASGYKCNGWNEDNTSLCVYNSYRR